MSHPQIHFCLSFHLAYARLRLQLDEELGTYHGIDFDDFALLHALDNAGDDAAGLALIAAELGTSRSALMRRLRPLEKIGLLTCHSTGMDRRLALRTPGRALIKTAQDTIARVCDRPSFTQNIRKLKDVLPEPGTDDDVKASAALRTV
jgi:DNA-binding MarR family transcriptional regulator